MGVSGERRRMKSGGLMIFLTRGSEAYRFTNQNWWCNGEKERDRGERQRVLKAVILREYDLGFGLVILKRERKEA